uniref:CSON015556 protein n=1 Tax=Culicoides sonorensis TaxID=179676 RepID=A0A336KV14_CULSO
MGICLDTESNTAAQDHEETNTDWKGGGDRGAAQRDQMAKTPVGLQPPMQNVGKVKFDPPKVPVIFVLGGPGSGKVTHCDTIMQERRGLVHINMMDLLQQYAIGNDMQDFSQLSSKTVTEVLMLEMKMSPQARAYLVSGYPRSMRDVVEYSEKIQVVNGVILISWRQAVLQKQIDYGAKLGHVVLSLAKMELENFFKHVMPVADYFDQSDMLVAVNGERTPTEVYQDFRVAVFDILNQQENQEALLNGVAGIGNGEHDIPGSIVSVDTAPSKREENEAAMAIGRFVESPLKQNTNMNGNVMKGNPTSIIQQPLQQHTNGPVTRQAFNPNKIPHIIWEALAAGEMINIRSLEKLLENQLIQLNDKTGVIIDGFPRHINQAKYFEERYKQKPPIILLDCSKLQLGRGRLDDTVASFRRRLELFRELTLPMLKQMDAAGRLTIVDGDTDSPTVQREFERIIRQQIQGVVGNAQILNVEQLEGEENFTSIGNFRDQIQGGKNHKNMMNDTTDIEMPGTVPTVSQHVAMNGYLNNKKQVNGGPQNGFIPNGRAYNNHI